MADFYISLLYGLSYLSLVVFFFYLLNLKKIKEKDKICEESTDKTVSIIIPAYNEEKSIEKTIESALAIDYPKEKFEIIVVDDGSRDNTFKLAKKYEKNNPNLQVFTKKNGGKGSALNFGIERAKNEIIITMDADTFAEPSAVKKMIAKFYSDDVIAVTPSMCVYKPKTLWQKIQQIEYYMGVFLRKSLAAINSIHVTPGAFSAYRKVFFDKHGGYDEHNITEDLEITLRIQSQDYIIENASEAVVYTVSPKTFKELMVQRRRWYTGLIKNLLSYKQLLFNWKKGILGLLVLPLAVFSIFSSVFLTGYFLIKSAEQILDNLNFLQSINFDIGGLFPTEIYLIKETLITFFYNTFSNPLFLLSVFVLLSLIFYLKFAKKRTKSKENLQFSFFLFILFFSLLYAFWWIISFIYLMFNKKVVWREEDVKKN